MKQTYISPKFLTVELHTENLMALSMNNTEQINSSNMNDYEQDVKGISIIDKNVWDEEW